MDTTRRTFINNSALIAGGLVSTIAPVAAAVAAEPAPAKAVAPTTGAAKLRALLKRPGLLVAAQAMNAETAAIAQHVGHEAIYIGGSVMARTLYHYEDIGMLLPSEMAAFACQVADAVTVPVITDIDQGGETPLNVYKNFRTLIRGNVACAQLEDSHNPKHIAGQADGSLNRLTTIEQMLIRIEAVMKAKAKEKGDIVLMARCDEFYNLTGVKGGDQKRAEENFIKRCNEYAKAGADIILAQSLTMEQIERCAKEISIPLVDDVLPIPELRKTKVKMHIALRNTGLINQYLEAIMRDLKDHDDFDHSKFALPKSTYVMPKVSHYQDMRKLGEDWVLSRDKVCTKNTL